MNGPNHPSSVPPAPGMHYRRKSTKLPKLPADDVQVIRDFVLRHITYVGGADKPEHCLVLGAKTQIYVMRQYISSDGPVQDSNIGFFNPANSDSIHRLEEEIGRLDSKDLVIVCDVRGEVMNLHISKNEPFGPPGSDGSNFSPTRKKGVKSLSDN